MTLTRKETIERLKQNKAAAEYYAGQSRINAEIENSLKDSEAFDMAIETLSADAVQGERGHMMIDGNKLMLALSEWWYSSFGLEETEESKAIHKVMDEVERYVDHEKSADYWIPCSERLPSEDGFYIATCDGEICGEDQPFTGFAEFENRKWVDDEDDYQCVLAWMPLPKPWKGADDE